MKLDFLIDTIVHDPLKSSIFTNETSLSDFLSQVSTTCVKDRFDR